MFQQIIRLDVNNKSNFECSFYYHKKTAIVATQIHMIRRRRRRIIRIIRLIRIIRIIRIIYYPRLLKGRCAASHAAQPLHSRGALVLGLRGGASPLRRPYFARIIYALVTVINNSRNHKTHTPGAGAQPPPAKPQGG